MEYHFNNNKHHFFKLIIQLLSAYFNDKPSPLQFESPVVTLRDMNPQTVETALLADVEQTMVLVQIMIPVFRTESVQAQDEVTEVFTSRY